MKVFTAANWLACDTRTKFSAVITKLQYKKEEIWAPIYIVKQWSKRKVSHLNAIRIFEGFSIRNGRVWIKIRETIVVDLKNYG